MDDDAIRSLFFARSPQALQALDKKYGRLCRRLACNILEDPRDAEECVNDAYLALWAAIPPARPAPLRAYLCKTVRNLALKAHARRHAQKRGGYDLALEELSAALPAGETAESALAARELARLVQRFLDTLSQADRVIFLGRYAFLDSYAQIAARTGLSEKNVSVRLSRIRKRLKAYLTEQEAL